MTAIVLLTWAMILGGPVAWWVLRRTATPRTPAAANASSLVMFLSLLLFLVAGAMLLFSGLYSVTNTVATALWLVAGLLAVWATGRWRFALPAIVERWSDRHEAGLRAQAEAGNPQAAHLLGLGLKLRGEHEPARRFLQQAAEAGLTNAQWDLARLLDEIEGPAAAKPWFAAAAAGGHRGAQHLLRPGGAYGATD
ncbi:hypothetical protein [Catellatospora sp. NPDC049609]|uniref:hypothetical protein n=1 Tax=Catellatospora sp. NPDC049609 TaxID=3155505 RepID=UPI00343B9A72